MSSSVATPDAPAQDISQLLKQLAENPPESVSAELARHGMDAEQLKAYLDSSPSSEDVELLRRVLLHGAQHGTSGDAELMGQLHVYLDPSRRTWDRLRQLKDSGDVVEYRVTQANRGGLIVDVGPGVRGFIPSSHVGLNRSPRLDDYVGQDLRLRVIELQPGRDTAVLTNRQILEEERRDQRREVLQQIETGQTYQGVVRRLNEIGAFVDIGGIDGLLHVSEISWKRVDHPSQVLKTGQTVQVKVLRVDAGSGKVALSMRQLATDPRDYARTHFPTGSTVEITIARVTPQGAEIDLEEGLEGLIPIAELSQDRVTNPEEVVQPGQTVSARVLDFRPREYQIIFSLRKAETRQEQRPEPKQERQQAEAPQARSGRRSERTTLGDLFGHLFENFGAPESQPERTAGKAKKEDAAPAATAAGASDDPDETERTAVAVPLEETATGPSGDPLAESAGLSAQPDAGDHSAPDDELELADVSELEPAALDSDQPDRESSAMSDDSAGDEPAQPEPELDEPELADVDDLEPASLDGDKPDPRLSATSDAVGGDEPEPEDRASESAPDEAAEADTSAVEPGLPAVDSGDGPTSDDDEQPAG